MNIGNNPQLGLGGDVDGGFTKGPVRDSMVLKPSDMITLADVRSDATTIDFNANLDPTDSSANHNQWPCNRHNGNTDILFAEGHVERPKRNDVINPARNDWRARWNNDNNPHTEVTWTISPSQKPNAPEQ